MRAQAFRSAGELEDLDRMVESGESNWRFQAIT